MDFGKIRAVIQQKQQNNENDFVIINEVIEELNEKKKIARNNITQSETRAEIAIYRIEEMTIEDIISEIGEFIYYNKNSIKLL